jgi:hypothetical protein
MRIVAVFRRGALLAACFATIAAAQASPAWLVRDAPGGFRFAVTGGKPAKPAPTLFLIGSSIEDTTRVETFARIAAPWLEAGGIAVTVDSPSHGVEQPPAREELAGGLTQAPAGGRRLRQPFTGRLRGLLDHLVERGYTDPGRVAVSGISRGGFLGLHFTASEPRVRRIAALAFVSDLIAPAEFNGAEQNALLRSLAVTHLVDRLAGRKFFGIIGSTPGAEFGRTGGGVFNIVTRGGGNRLHGSLWELHTDPAAAG